MARRGLVAIGLLLICIIAMLVFKGLFKKKVQEGFAVINPVGRLSRLLMSGIIGLFITISRSGNIYFGCNNNSNSYNNIHIYNGDLVYLTGSDRGYVDGRAINFGQFQDLDEDNQNDPRNYLEIAKFDNIEGITIDPSNENLYVVDSTNHAIRKIVIATGIVTTIVTGLNNPIGIIIDNSGQKLYVSDGADIRKIVIANGTVTTIARDVFATGLVLDSSQQNIYITQRHVVSKIVIATGQVTTFAGGASGYNINGIGTAASFSQPYGIAIDNSGQSLYVTDVDNNNIRKIVIATREVSTFLDYSDVNDLNSPTGIIIDSSGIIYVRDSGGVSKIVMVCGPGSQLSNGVCVECPNGKYSPDGSPCITCGLSPGATTMATSKISCAASACQTGYYLSGGQCVESPAGSFSAGGSVTSSTPCAAGFYSAARATACTACAAGSYSSSTGASSCTACGTSLGAKTMGSSTTKCEPSVCSGGYKLSSVNGVNQCSKCLAGTYSGEGATTCTTCAPRTFSADGATTCVSCQPGTGQKTMIESATSCTPSVCLAGYKLSGGQCVQCGAGFSSPEGSTTCTSCSAGSYSAAGSASCSSCAAGSYSSAQASVCTTCADGTYSASGSLACTTCNKSAGAATMSSSKTSCTAATCLPGYKVVDGSCEKCGAGFYGADGISCTACAAGLSSEPGSAGPSACKCPANSYGINNSCTSCPTGSVSPIGSTTVSACTCSANYYGTNGQCTACPSGAVSPANSTTASACVCPPGTTLITIGSTNYCIGIDQVNKYSMKAYNPSTKSTYNNGVKTSLVLVKNTGLCPPNSTDPCCSQESSTNKDCIKRGFWKPSKVFDTN